MKVGKYIAFLEAILIAAMVFVLPLYWHAVVWFIPLWLVTSLWQGRKHYRQLFTVESIPFRLFLFFFLFYLVSLISVVYSSNQHEGWFDVQVKLSLLVVPLLMLGSKDNIIRYRSLIAGAFVAGLLLAGIICTGTAFYRSFSIVDHHLIFKPHPYADPHLSFWFLFKSGLGYFTYTNFSVLLHPSYYSMFLCLGLLFLLEWIKRTPHVKRQIGLITVAIFFAILLIILNSRGALLAFFLMAMVYGLLEYRGKTGYVILILFIPVVVFLSIHTRMYTIGLPNQRLEIWQKAWHVWTENRWWGVGTGDVKESIHAVHIDTGSGIPVQDNVHNQFLETAVGTGIPGLFSLVAIFVAGFFYAIRNRKKMLFYFLLVVLVNFFFESMLNRFFGVFFFSFFYFFLCLVDEQERGQS